MTPPAPEDRHDHEHAHLRSSRAEQRRAPGQAQLRGAGKKKFPLLLVFPPSLSHNPSAPHVHRFTFALIVETLGFDIKLTIFPIFPSPNCLRVPVCGIIS